MMLLALRQEFKKLRFQMIADREPRGEAWTADVVRDLCAECELIHCVDPFEATSVYGEMRYWRLHGRGSYSYRYTDDDLINLRQMLATRPQHGYLMFNNFSSKMDALRLRTLSGP